MPTNSACAWRIAIVWLLFIGLLAAWNPLLLAQTPGTGALTGTVTDSSGAVVPNVKVTATSVDTGQTRTATTANDGTYKIGLLPPGNYRVTFESSGFKPVEIPSATVNVTETEVLDRTLEVGAQTQTVTVEGEVETVQTTSSALGTVANTRTVTELPLSTRNYTSLLALSAGANSSVQNASQIGKAPIFIAVNGAGFGQNTYLQDGVPVDDWFSFNTGAEGASGGSFALPNPDTIAEFKIQTSTYDAGYGRNPGANVNVVTKTGTNNLHGSAFEFFRNTSLNANDWFLNQAGQPKGVLNANVYGGTVGGKIKKDKLFFFVSYQESDQKNGLSGYGLSSVSLPPIPSGARGTCPTPTAANSATSAAYFAACDATAQAFISNLATLNSSAAGCPNSGNAQFKPQAVGSVAVQCPGTAGTTDALFNVNPVAIKLLQLQLGNGAYMVPSTGLTGYGTQSFSSPATFHDHNAMGNLDYVINNRNTLSARYQYEADPTTAPFPVMNSTQTQDFLPGNPISTTKTDDAATLRLTSILSNNLVNQGYIAYQRYGSVSQDLTPFTNSAVGITDLQPGVDLLSQLTIGSTSAGQGFQLGAQYQFGDNNPTNQFLAADEISWNHGKHTFRTGVGGERVQTRIFYPSHAAGNPTFPSFTDFLIGRAGNCGAASPGCNGGTASSLRSVGTFTTANAAFSLYFHVQDLDAFIQDDFKVNSRLTLNLGVRWEYDGYVTEKDGLMSNLWPGLMNGSLPGTTTATGTLAGYVVPANYPGAPPSGVFLNSNNSVNPTGAPRDDFAPRVGFAWQPLATNRWVVRGGAGMFYDVTPGVTLLNILEVTEPALGTPVLSNAPQATLQDPWVLPAGIVPGPPGTFGFTPRWVNPATNTSSNISQSVIQPDIGVPLSYQWNLNTQYEFLRNWVLELGYVGSHGIHQAYVSPAGLQGMASTQDYNIAQLVGDATCTGCAAYGLKTNTVANVVERVPELGVSATNSELANTSAYKFNSLQVTVRKQLSKGLQLQGAYTWSRAFFSIPFGVDTYPYLVQEWTPNTNYHPNRFVLNYVWNLPLGTHKGFMGQALNNWSWSGVLTVQDGVPLTIEDTGGSIFFGGQGVGSATGFSSTAQLCPGMTYANLATSGNMDQRVTNGYLNGKAQGVLCALPAIGNGTGFGSIGGGAILGPPQDNWDMSIAKSFNVREAQSLQFRAEFFNTFNHPQFAIPDTLASDAAFGKIGAMSVNPRIIQLALKYSF